MRWRLAIFAVYWLASLTLMPTNLAWGYIDPATTTYIIQIAAAVVITLGVSLGVFLYKLQMVVTNVKVSAHALMRSLQHRRNRSGTSAKGAVNGGEIGGIAQLGEEEALTVGVIDYAIPARLNYCGLAFEPAVDVGFSGGFDTETSSGNKGSEKLGLGVGSGFGISEQSGLRAGASSIEGDAHPTRESDVAARLHALGHWVWDDRRSFKERATMAVVVAAALSFTFIVFSMLDSVIQNEAKMNFSFAEIVGPVLLFGVVASLAVSILLLPLKGRVFDFAACLLLSLLIGGYLQSTFLNASVGPLMGLPLSWEELGVVSVLGNLLVWLVVFATIFFFGLSGKGKVQHAFGRFALFSSALIIAVQMVALLTVLPPVDDWNANRSGGAVQTLTTKGMYDVSPGENIIVFVLDMLDEEFIEGVFLEDPGFFDNLDGFTRFTNNVSVYNSTFPSVVNLMTGEPFDPNVTSERYIENAYSQNTFVEDIHDQGFACNLYMEKMYTYSDGGQLASFAGNIEETTFSVDTPEILTLMTRLSLLKSVPLAFKAPFSIHPDDFRRLGAAEKTGGADPYVADDPRFYLQLQREGLMETGASGQFTYYHLNGSHYPFHMDANAEYVEEETTGIEQTKGSFLILEEYFTQMKEMGIYKDATIIITGDHPTHLLYKTLDKPMLVGLFVKPSGEEGVPLRYSDAPVSLENLRATCVEAAGGNPSAWGKTYFEVGEDDRVERHYFNRFTEEATRAHYIAHYRIIGEAREWDNWELVEMIPYDSKYWF